MERDLLVKSFAHKSTSRAESSKPQGARKQAFEIKNVAACANHIGRASPVHSTSRVAFLANKFF
jgi:hypothetical protein